VKALLIPVDGPPREVVLAGGGGTRFMRTLRTLISTDCAERIRVTSRWEAWLDEDGSAAGKQVNQAATLLAQSYGWRLSLLGTVVIVGLDKDATKPTKLSQAQVDAIIRKVSCPPSALPKAAQQHERKAGLLASEPDGSVHRSRTRRAGITTGQIRQRHACTTPVAQRAAIALGLEPAQRENARIAIHRTPEKSGTYRSPHSGWLASPSRPRTPATARWQARLHQARGVALAAAGRPRQASVRAASVALLDAGRARGPDAVRRRVGRHRA